MTSRTSSATPPAKSPEANDTMTLVQAAAICQVLAEATSLNGDDLTRAL